MTLRSVSAPATPIGSSRAPRVVRAWRPDRLEWLTPEPEYGIWAGLTRCVSGGSARGRGELVPQLPGLRAVGAAAAGQRLEGCSGWRRLAGLELSERKIEERLLTRRPGGLAAGPLELGGGFRRAPQQQQAHAAVETRRSALRPAGEQRAQAPFGLPEIITLV